MIKRTRVFYPHIVKQYDSVEQFITENDYTDYLDAQKAEFVAAGIDVSNSSQYAIALSEDGFEGKVTVVFADQAQYDAYLAATQEYAHRSPIFDEVVEEHLI